MDCMLLVFGSKSFSMRISKVSFDEFAGVLRDTRFMWDEMFCLDNTEN